MTTLQEAKSGAEKEGTERIEKFRAAIRRSVWIVGSVVMILLATYWVGNWVNSPPQAVATLPPPTQPQISTPTCSAEGETKVISTEWVTINPGFQCGVVYEVAEGTVFIGEPSNHIEDSAGTEDMGNILKKKGIRIIAVRAKDGTATLNYKLCELGTATNWGTCRPSPTDFAGHGVVVSLGVGAGVAVR